MPSCYRFSSILCFDSALCWLLCVPCGDEASRYNDILVALNVLLPGCVAGCRVPLATAMRIAMIRVNR